MRGSMMHESMLNIAARWEDLAANARTEALGLMSDH
jgi:hypothetical protein